MSDIDAAATVRVARLEARVRALLALNVASLSLIGVAALTGFAPLRTATVRFAGDSISVRELRVIDSTGTVRVRLSADMPDAVIRGRRVRRPEQAAGIMLYDDLGQERGGYVTFAPSRSIALTLDTRQSQVAAFAAESSGGAALGLFEGNDRLEVRANKATGTGLFVWKDGGLALQNPPLGEAEEAKVCVEMKDEIAAAQARANLQLDQPRVLAACRLHLSDVGCRKCFGQRAPNGGRR